MKVQSLSIVVPGKCSNNCHFCISKTRKDNYPDIISGTSSKGIEEAYVRRLKFARKMGVDNVIFTGAGEPLQNLPMITKLVSFIRLANGFNYMELQTSGIGLNEQLLKHLRDLGFSTISLSLSSLTTKENYEINRISRKHAFDIQALCKGIKEKGLNLRISLNMNSLFNGVNPYSLFSKLADLGADQVTFRKLYAPKGTPQYEWIKAHEYTDFTILEEYIKEYGNPLEKLSFGLRKYSVNGISTVLDTDCMLKDETESSTYRYLILRPNCKLYSRWDDKGSLIF